MNSTIEPLTFLVQIIQPSLILISDTIWEPRISRERVRTYNPRVFFFFFWTTHTIQESRYSSSHIATFFSDSRNQVLFSVLNFLYWKLGHIHDSLTNQISFLKWEWTKKIAMVRMQMIIIDNYVWIYILLVVSNSGVTEYDIGVKAMNIDAMIWLSSNIEMFISYIKISISCWLPIFS